jgi:hypothetical protein
MLLLVASRVSAILLLLVAGSLRMQKSEPLYE